jgi:DMSO reductase family type II enzyme heme b subunit
VEAKIERLQVKRRRIPVPALVAIFWIGFYLFLKFLIEPPLPSSLIYMYMAMITVGLVMAVSIFEGILRRFKDPVVGFLRGDLLGAWHWRAAWWVLLVTIPIYAGHQVYQRVVPRFEPPIASRVIHPAPPPEVATLYNSLRDDEEHLQQYIREGRRIYFENCFFCHGDALDGEGHFAHGIVPPPADFEDPGTIAQLQESFVFWRVSAGGPGLPDESTPWDSFMPQWETMLTEEERWKVILYLYDATGWTPRTWEEAEEAEEATEEVKPIEKAPETEASRMIYEKRCSHCHGEDGRGDGPAAGFVIPRPRDFTSGVYKFRSTPSGFPPTDEDLARSIRQGMPGTAMPAWKQFTDGEVRALVQHIKGFSPGTFDPHPPQADPPQPLQIGIPPKPSSEQIEKGKQVFQDAKCWECHGKVGRGDGEKAWDPDFKDDWGQRIFPRDLTHPWEYRNGATVEDIYRTVTTGLDGTPMASFQDSFSDEERWALAQYVKSIQVQRRLEIALRVKQIEGIPTDPDSPIWDQAEYLDIPMVGQIVVEPRMFTPRVDNVRVRALYTDTDVGVLLEWDDRRPNRGGDAHPDGTGIQFPVTISGTVAKPYFGMGDPNNPVYIWAWMDNAEGAVEYNATGPKKEAITRQPGSDLSVESEYKDGRYRVIFTRQLINQDKEDLQFRRGEFIPFALAVYDGDNGEQKGQKAISAWYYLILEPPTPATVYLYPFVTILVAGGAEWWFIRRIRKNKGTGK